MGFREGFSAQWISRPMNQHLPRYEREKHLPSILLLESWQGGVFFRRSFDSLRSLRMTLVAWRVYD